MKPWHSLEGKTIWVTGGAGYLGSAITIELDQQCAKVLCFDLAGKAEAFVREQGLKRTVPLTLDVNDPAGLPAAVDALVSEHGLPDGVVHLATASSRGKSLEDLPADEFQRTFDQSLTPTFVFCRLLGERMKQRGHGSVVLFASMYGLVAPDPRIYHPPMTVNPIDYGAAKAALLQMSRYLAVHYGPSGVRFNCVTPGPFPNPAVQANYPSFIEDLNRKTALRRIGFNREIVGPTLFLLTDSASFVTGHSLVVDGGWTVW
ncbi:MAG TPA: SDR family oxidoreductase [Opitutaceae bacterium]|nr:SDR family oxidoreductase [Opitutaceae bacterium]